MVSLPMVRTLRQMAEWRVRLPSRERRGGQFPVWEKQLPRSQAIFLPEVLRFPPR